MSNLYQQPGRDQSIDSRWELTHIETLVERLPLYATVGIRKRVAGLNEVTPDAHPIIGPTPLKGFYVLSGFSGHGFMHGPISGLLISEIICEGYAQTVDVSMLDYGCFGEGRLMQEYQVV